MVRRTGGGYSALVEAIQAEDLGNNVICMDDVSDETLRALYQMALMFVYPSLNEGFGLPLPEAMASGLPIVTSPEAASNEVVGDAALYCQLGDSGQWVATITDLMRNTRQQNQLSKKSRYQAGLFTWESVALKILNNT
jgi:glycosyltransferase involved in cell wall biosynthesis